jgi:DNA modification methylase
LEIEKKWMFRQKNKEYMAEPILDWILNGIPNPPKVKLFDDVGFIYEAQLAKMELSSWWDNPEEFRKRAAYYEEVNDEKTYHYHISNITGKGQIGRSNQYLTHWYYPYKAKFHPQMIKAIINWMGLKRQDTLLDPFAGSGTALIESKLVGVNSIGIDIDPLCILMSKVKTDLLDMSAEELKSISLKAAFDFFHRRKLRAQASVGLEKFLPIYSEDYDMGPFKECDERIYNFYLLSYLYALSDWRYIKVDMWKQFNKNTKNMIKNIERFSELKENLDFEFGDTKIIQGDARFLTSFGIRSSSIDGIVTSPPYSIAVDYIAQDLHAFHYLDIDPQKLQDKLVGLKGKGEERIRIYYEDMQLAFNSMFEVLKSKALCTVVIGDVTYNGYRLPISETYVKLAKNAGFEYVGIIRRPILGGFARLRYEYMLLFKKP